MSGPAADVGVFGGSGLSHLLDGVEEMIIDTPYGPPSAPVVIGTVGERRVAFLPRHGRDHEFPPHRVPYRANVWAMHALGVRALLGPCAAGSLRPDIHPGDLVVLDQFVDRTNGRPDTFHDRFDDGPAHAPMAAPYDRRVAGAVIAAAQATGMPVHLDGTVVVVNGPRFSTRAESSWHRQMGADVVNMTQYPEVALAVELEVPYAGVALVTDYDTGVEGVAAVTQEEVFSTFEKNRGPLRDVLLGAVARLDL